MIFQPASTMHWTYGSRLPVGITTTSGVQIAPGVLAVPLPGVVGVPLCGAVVVLLPGGPQEIAVHASRTAAAPASNRDAFGRSCGTPVLRMPLSSMCTPPYGEQTNGIGGGPVSKPDDGGQHCQR